MTAVTHCHCFPVQFKATLAHFQQVKEADSYLLETLNIPYYPSKTFFTYNKKDTSKQQYSLQYLHSHHSISNNLY